MRKAKDDAERKVISDIKKHGSHNVHVFGDEAHPPFSYTIGLYENYLHPEIIIIGLRSELCHVLLNNMAHEIKNGKSFAAGEYHEGVLDDFLCYFGEVQRTMYRNYMGWALWFYDGFDFPLLQCVPPTVKGKFPWDKDFPEEARFFLRVIAEPPKEH